MILTCAVCGTHNRVPVARLADVPRCGRCKQGLELAAPVPIASAAELSELVAASPLPVVVDFWAAWCGPCRMVAPEVDKLARNFAGRVIVAKVDTEAVPDAAARHAVSGIPAFVAFQGGRERARAVGSMSASQLAQRLGLPA